MRQAVVYARYSPGSTQTYQSIEGQLTECRKFAAANDLQIVRTYEDEHLTGRNDQRPAFQQLLKDSATSKWDIVLVYAIDRFGRNSIEIAINKYHLQKNGKTVISATQRTARNVDGSKNLDGILLENFYIGMAEYYSEELSQKSLEDCVKVTQRVILPAGALFMDIKLSTTHAVPATASREKY